MASLEKFRAFINRNILLVVMIPGIGGIHWGWQKIQEKDVFVAPHERREFPPITVDNLVFVINLLLKVVSI